jgi:hypothetical protein
MSNTAAVAAAGWSGMSIQEPLQSQAAQQHSVLTLLQQLREHVQPEGLALLNTLGQQVAGDSNSHTAALQQQQQQQQLTLQAAAALQQPGLLLLCSSLGCC